MRSNRPPWACPHASWAAPAHETRRGAYAGAAGPAAYDALPKSPRPPAQRRRPPPSNPYNVLTRPALRIPFASGTQLWASDPDIVVAAIEDPERQLEKGSLYDPFRSLAPLHLVALEGEAHTRMRGVVQPLVAGAGLKDLMPTVSRHAAALADALAAQGGAPRIDVRVRQMTLDIISDAMFGLGGFGALRLDRASMKTGSPVAGEVGGPASALGVVMETLHWRAVDLSDQGWREILKLLPLKDGDDPGSVWSHPAQGPVVAAALRTLDEYIIARAAELGAAERGPLLARIAHRGRRASPPLSPFEVRQLCITLLTMGHENVSSGVSWALLHLAGDEAVQRRAREEVVAAAGADGPLEWAHLSALPTLCRVFEEAVRLFPSVPGLTRRPVRDAVVGGVRVPAGVEVVLNLPALHRAELGGAPDYSTDRRSLAFGGGRRGCLGRHLAYLEALVTSAAVLRRGELRRAPAPGGGAPATLRGEVFVSLRPREKEARVTFAPAPPRGRL